MADSRITMDEAKRLTSGMAGTIRDIVRGHEENAHSGVPCSATRIRILAALAQQLDIQTFSGEIERFAASLDDAWATSSRHRPLPRVYVVSSWRNEFQQGVVRDLRDAGMSVYDFKNPEPGNDGFRWSEIDPKWKEWAPEQWAAALKHPVAQIGFENDLSGMIWADVGVLVLPAGPSAHLEAGWMAGQRKPVYAYIPPGVRPEPDLMYNLLAREAIHTDINSIIAILKS